MVAQGLPSSPRLDDATVLAVIYFNVRAGVTGSQSWSCKGDLCIATAPLFFKVWQVAAIVHVANGAFLP